jgi:hypothetical protein
MARNNNLHVGCLVKSKSYEELKKFGFKNKPEDIPYMNDVGVVIQILDNHVRVLWQKLEKEINHFPYTLDKIAD